MESLPLFPLGTVLLPGVPLPLRIFEPRYVAMITHVGRADRPEDRVFGVVAIRRGTEVGTPAPTLYDVGCSAQISSITRHDDHLMIETTGRRRFRIAAVHEDRAPYLVADITWMAPEADDSGGAPSGSVVATQESFRRFARALGSRAEELPDGPGLLSAAVLEGLGLPRPERQAVLEAGDTDARLQALRRLCRREHALAEILRMRTARVIPSSRLSPN